MCLLCLNVMVIIHHELHPAQRVVCNEDVGMQIAHASLIAINICTLLPEVTCHWLNQQSSCVASICVPAAGRLWLSLLLIDSGVHLMSNQLVPRAVAS